MPATGSHTSTHSPHAGCTGTVAASPNCGTIHATHDLSAPSGSICCRGTPHPDNYLPACRTSLQPGPGRTRRTRWTRAWTQQESRIWTCTTRASATHNWLWHPPPAGGAAAQTQHGRFAPNPKKYYNNHNMCFSCGWDIPGWHTSQTCPHECRKAGHQEGCDRQNAAAYTTAGHVVSKAGSHKKEMPINPGPHQA